MSETFPDRLLRLRRERGLRQHELGARVGVKQQAISEWENGTSRPMRKYPPKLAEALGVSLSYLRTGAEQ